MFGNLAVMFFSLLMVIVLYSAFWLPYIRGVKDENPRLIQLGAATGFLAYIT